ncbi:MAG: NAD(P)H-hydrate dehydratase [Thermoplasmata archaeon]|nr:NAD(P)H-hydrate dehydratase [Thermoplasmata archaeon]
MALADDGPVTALDMAVAERNAVALGISLDVLMENAGRAIAEEAARRLPAAPARVGVLTGPGNNGGDGACAAFYLEQWGYRPELWAVRPPAEIRSATARRCFERLARRTPIHVGVPTAAQLSEYALIVDALLGTGQVGPLRTPFSGMVAAAQQSGVPILAADEPTGLGQPDGLRPRWTVALTSTKVGMTAESCGEIIVRDIGIPPLARRQTGPGEFLYYPAPPPGGDHPRPGRVVVIGGGPFAGAPTLAALSALRSGAERATIIVPLPAAEVVQSFSPDLVVVPVGEGHFRAADVPTIEQWLAEHPTDAIVLGMGIGRLDATQAAMRELLPRLIGRWPLVVDADALEALVAVHPSSRPALPLVATPNQTEYKRDFAGEPNGGLAAGLDHARRWAGALHVTVLVKGPADLIADAGIAIANLHHPPALAVSGVGDALAGVVGSLLARGVAPVAAARLAAYWIGDAGERLASRFGPGLVATDVVSELPATLLAGLERVGRAGEGRGPVQA